MVGFLLGVVGNLVAALLCGVPAYWHHHRTGKRRHAEVMAAIENPMNTATGGGPHGRQEAASSVDEG
jgi:hypothetical protein